MYPYLILGAGPAGLQMAHELSRAGRDYLVLEAGPEPAHFFARFPRLRRLISINKIYTGYQDKEKNLRWDWNSLLCDDDRLLFSNYSKQYWPTAEELVQYCSDFARLLGLNIKYKTKVVRIERDGAAFVAVDAGGQTYRAERLIVATGISLPYIPDIPGIQDCENYFDVDMDPASFAGQRVLILGKGNSGFELAEALTGATALLHICSPNPIKMAWKTHHVGHLRAINNNFLDTYQLKLQNAVIDATVCDIQRQGGRFVVTLRYAHAEGEIETIVYDRVVVCTGFKMDASTFAPEVAPELIVDGRLPAQTSAWESTNITHMYFAGVLMQARDYKKASSSFIHGFRYNIRALHRILESRYHGVPLPSRNIARTPGACTEAVLEAMNRSSALWQQFGFLADVLHVTGSDSLRYYEALPVDYVRSYLMDDSQEYYLATLEYGDRHPRDIFAVSRVHRDAADRGDESQFLHPVVRHYIGGQIASTHHVIEDLESTWDEPIHTQPLLAFFGESLG